MHFRDRETVYVPLGVRILYVYATACTHPGLRFDKTVS